MSVKRGRRRSEGSKGQRRRVGPERYEVTLSPRALVRTLVITAFALLTCHGVLSVYHYRVEELPWLLIQLFDVDEENNLPTWFSEFLLLTACVCTWLCARKKRADGDPWVRYWYVLVVGFLLMAIDEVAGVHESINSVIVITWAIPAGIASLFAGLAFVPFLRHLPRRTALLFALAGLGFLIGAAGLEIIGNSLVAQRLRNTLEYKLWTLVEEGLEMSGVILFIYALLNYMREPGAKSVDVALELN